MYTFTTINDRIYNVHTRKDGTYYAIVKGKRQNVDTQFVMTSNSKPCNSDKERLSNGKCYKKCKSPLERSTTTFKCKKKQNIIYLEKQGYGRMFQTSIQIGNRIMVFRDIYGELNKNPLILLNQLAKATGMTISKNGKRLKKSEIVNELKKYIRFNE